MKTAKEIFEELNSFDENRRIEAKSASAVGKSMMETVCAFANEPGLQGGYLLLGAKRVGMTGDGKPIYEPENIENSDKIQSDFVAMCNSVFNIHIRPIIQVEEYQGKTVVVVKIEELPVSQKPVYFAKRGLPDGAFVASVLRMRNVLRKTCTYSISRQTHTTVVWWMIPTLMILMRMPWGSIGDFVRR